MKAKTESNFLTKFCFLIISIYLVLGNIPRIVHISGVTNNLVITEILLYFTLIGYALVSNKLHISLIKIWGIISVIMFSFCYGVFLNGFDSNALMYSVRLILMFLSANIAGYVMFKVYKTDIVKSFNFLLKIYFVLMVFGLLIIVMFPNSVDLWTFLANYGIIFNGDPHQNRFVSPYFDPNFYGAIVLIPIMISGFLFKETRKKRYMLLFLLFTVSLFFTYSRSGIGAAVILILILITNKLLSFKPKISLGRVVILWWTLPIVGFVIYKNLDAFSRIIQRFSSITTDHSALARLNTFNIGYQIFSENPLMGIGYDNLSQRMRNLVSLSSVDSSLLSIIINFGMIFTSILLIMFIYFIVKTRKSIKLKYDKGSRYLRFFDMFIVYILISIVFTCQFNNLLFYQFWLFPCLTICSYFEHISLQKQKSNEQYTIKTSASA